MADNIGKAVLSWHKLPGSPPTPYLGLIVGETHSYWKLRVRDKQFTCLKAACSTKPFKARATK